MTTVQLIALTVGASGVVPVLAMRARIPPPIALLVAGIGLALVPGVPDLELDPFVVIFLFLPPIVYAATLRSSLRRLAQIASWAVLPGALLILVPMGILAVTAHMVVDGLAWSSAVVLGGIAAASEAAFVVAANASLRLPRRVITRLRAETTVLPLVLLPLILLAIDAAVSDEFALGEAALGYLYDVFGGLGIGAVAGLLGVRVRHATPDGPPQIAVSFAIPFLAGLAGFAATASPVSAIIAAGFVVEAHYSGRSPERPYSASTQELGRAFWLQTTLLLAGTLAFIVGLSIPAAVEDLDVPLGSMVAYVAGGLALVTAVRFVIAYATAGRGSHADELVRVKEAVVLAWGATRTPLAFVIALLVPPVVAAGDPFPDRDLILVFSAGLVVASALIQGPTIGPLIRRLGLAGDGGVAAEERAARSIVVQAGREWLASANVSQPTRGAAVDAIMLDVFNAQRAALVRLYDADEIGEETLLALRQEIDLEQQRSVGGLGRDFALERLAGSA